jgi:DNA-binding CsgD family transcriptional regulator
MLGIVAVHGTGCISRPHGIFAEISQPAGIAARCSPLYRSTVATEWARARCRERLERLADSTQDCDSLRREVIAELKQAIGFEQWCAPLVDPDTLIAHTGMGETAHLVDMPLLQLHDASLRERNNGVGLARGRDHVGCLSAITAGDLARSRRWEESLNHYGTGDELRVAGVDERGCWGRFDLWRDRDDRPFGADDASLLRAAAPTLGRALRRATVTPSNGTPGAPREAGVLLIGPDLAPRGGTPAVRAWFRALNPGGIPYKDGIPSLVWTTVGRLIAGEQGENPERPARLRVRAGDGAWAVVEAARLDGPDRVLAVSMHPAGVDDVLGVACRAYGLSTRERQLVRLVARGLDTPTIADRLCVSRYTVQDHLKSIFEKTGVHGRLELVSSVFGQAT